MSWLRNQNVRGALLAAIDHVLANGVDHLSDALRVVRFLNGRARFAPRPDDIYIATYPRSGTTWMQYIVQLLLSSGPPRFQHIADVSPWWERSLAYRKNAAEEFDGMRGRRAFKTHLPYRWLPSTGRCIYIERDGIDVAASYYRLYQAYLGFDGTFDEFFARFLRGDLQYRSWFKHVAGWRLQRNNPRVLLLSYEEMQADLAGCIGQVAAFVGVPLSEERLIQTCEACGLQAMRRQQHRFDHGGDILRQLGVVSGSFIGRGQVGAARDELSESQRELFELRLHEGLSRADREIRIADFLH